MSDGWQTVKIPRGHWECQPFVEIPISENAPLEIANLFHIVHEEISKDVFKDLVTLRFSYHSKGNYVYISNPVRVSYLDEGTATLKIFIGLIEGAVNYGVKIGRYA